MRLQCSPSQYTHWFPVDVFRQFFFPRGSVFLKLRALSNKSAIIGNCRLMSTDQRTTNKTAPSVSHRRRQSPKSFRATCLTASLSGSINPDLVTAAKKQPASAAYKDREIHISLNWRRSSSVLRMPRFSSTYIPHTHKLLADHLQTTITYQINVVRDFDYFLFEKIPVYVASLYVIGYYKVVIV